MKKQIKADSFLQFQYVSAPAFSPDGKKVGFVVQHADLKDNTYYGDIWMLDAATKKVSQLTSGGDAKGFVFAPDGKVLFAAKRTKEEKEKEEETVFYEIDPAGGEARKAFSLPIRAGKIVPVDEDLYVIQATQNNGETDKDRGWETLEETPFWFNGRGFTAGLRGRIYLYSRSSGELTAVTEPWFDASLGEVDGRRFLYRGALWEGGRKYDYPGLYLYDIDSKTSKCLIEPNTKAGYVSDFWLDKILFTTYEDGVNVGMYNPDFYLLDPETKELRLFARYDRAVGSSVGSDARLGGGKAAKRLKDRWYFITTDCEGAYLRYLGADGTVSGNLTPEGSADCFDITEDHLAVCGLFGDRLPELYLDGEQVTHFNDAFVEEFDIRTPEYFEFDNKDGVSIHGYIMEPAAASSDDAPVSLAGPDGRFPCILHIHGGPATVFGSVYHHEMQLWANAGFYVIFCNPRGSDGRGGEFEDICDRYGGIDYEDLMEFTDEALRRCPKIDPERLGVTGGSYGGFMTNWIIGHTNRFKAACSQRSIAAWTIFEHTSDIGYSFTKWHQGARTRDEQAVRATSGRLQEPDDIPIPRSGLKQLWAHSPLAAAPNCQTPTLFIHSDKDYRCWMAEGISMFTALQMNGCPSKMVLFHDETHELSRSGKPKNRIHRMEEILAWMEKYLK